MSLGDIIAAGAFVLAIGALLVGLVYGWSKHMGHGEPGQAHRGARTAPGSRAVSLLTSLIGRIVAPVVVIRMVAAVAMAWWPAIVSILTTLAAAVAAGVTLLVAWLWWVRRRRMCSSPAGAAALGRPVAVLSPDFLPETTKSWPSRVYGRSTIRRSWFFSVLTALWSRLRPEACFHSWQPRSPKW